MEIFLDYQCPVCKQFEGQFGPTLDDMATKGEIQLIYRTMTFLDNNLKNDSSTKAGIAAACADNAGSYSAYHNAIFAGQPTTEGKGYTTQQLRVDFAATAGITGDKLSGFRPATTPAPRPRSWRAPTRGRPRRASTPPRRSW